MRLVTIIMFGDTEYCTDTLNKKYI